MLYTSIVAIKLVYLPFYTIRIKPNVGRYANLVQSHECYRTNVQPIGATCTGDQCESCSSEDAQGPFPGSSLNNKAAIGFGRFHVVRWNGEQGKVYMFFWFIYSIYILYAYIGDIVDTGLNGWKVSPHTNQSTVKGLGVAKKKGCRGIFLAQHSTF